MITLAENQKVLTKGKVLMILRDSAPILMNGFPRFLRSVNIWEPHYFYLLFLALFSPKKG